MLQSPTLLQEIQVLQIGSEREKMYGQQNSNLEIDVLFKNIMYAFKNGKHLT